MGLGDTLKLLYALLIIFVAVLVLGVDFNTAKDLVISLWEFANACTKFGTVIMVLIFLMSIVTAISKFGKFINKMFK